MISQTAEYALRAVVFLAEHGPCAKTIQEIARATRVPAGYLSKVMQALARAHIVHSQRGLGGGFALAVSPSDITIYTVVQTVDPIVRITRCPLDHPGHCEELCALHQRLDEATAAIEESFRQSTVADLLVKPIFDALPLPA